MIFKRFLSIPGSLFVLFIITGFGVTLGFWSMGWLHFNDLRHWITVRQAANSWKRDRTTASLMPAFNRFGVKVKVIIFFQQAFKRPRFVVFVILERTYQLSTEWLTGDVGNILYEKLLSYMQRILFSCCRSPDSTSISLPFLGLPVISLYCYLVEFFVLFKVPLAFLGFAVSMGLNECSVLF